ncbi:MAG: BMP family ABC transporter substrate-binding protein [Actinobacteria bacterium]|nr:BMP family ABC transporter substrate-binding protein [Actinomycetota bacterium]
MKRTKAFSVLALASAVSLLGAACGSDDDTDTTDAPSGSGETGDFKIGLAYDVGGRGDLSFNDSAAEGLDRVKAEFGVESQELSPANDEDRLENLKLLASDGYSPIIGVGFAYADGIAEVAEAYGDLTFGIIDSVVDAANVKSVTFAEHEGSFLVGAIAAKKSQTGHIGFVGGVDNSLIAKFEAGYVAGAKYVNPDITIDVQYITPDGDFTGFNDPAKGQEIAGAMYEAGADVIFHAAGGSGTGVFNAAVAAGEGKWAIGVDSDQHKTASPEQQPHILTSMLKRVDVAVETIVREFADGNTEGGLIELDLKSDGVGYSKTGGFVDDIASEIDEIKAKIVSGEITVSDTPA